MAHSPLRSRTDRSKRTRRPISATSPAVHRGMPVRPVVHRCASPSVPPAVRTGTLGSCGSWFPRRRPSSSLPWPCPPPQLFLMLAPGHRPARQRSARQRSARLSPAWRASARTRRPAPTRRGHTPPGLRRTGTSPGRCPLGLQSFAPSISPEISGLQVTAASTCWRPWANRCSARETASWPSRESSQAEEFSPFNIPMGSARHTSRLMSAWHPAHSFTEVPRSASSPTGPDTACPFTAFIGGPSPERPTGIPCHCWVSAGQFFCPLAETERLKDRNGGDQARGCACRYERLRRSTETWV